MPADQTQPYDPVRGGNARYDTSQMWDNGAGRLTDGQYTYDSNGLAWDRPDDLSNTRDLSGGGGGGMVGGGGGDLLADPYVQQYKSQLMAQSAADKASTVANLRTLLVQFGLVPQNFNDSMGALDDTTRALIQKNTDTGISQYARLLEGKGDVQRATIGQLAGSGLSRSGAKGFKLRRGQLDFDRGLNDAISSVNQKANEGQSAFAANELARQNQLAQFLAQMSANFRMSSGSYAPKPMPQAPAPQPQVDPQQYWESNPAPTYTNPSTGTNWYGGFGGLESTKFPGKAGF